MAVIMNITTMIAAVAVAETTSKLSIKKVAAVVAASTVAKVIYIRRKPKRRKNV